MEKLHPKVIWLFFVRAIFSGLILLFVGGSFIVPAIIGIVVDKSEGEAGSQLVDYCSTGCFLGIIIGFLLFLGLYLALCYIWARLSYRYWRYELADNALKVEKGVIWKKYISIPYERVQNVDIYRGLLARILGLSDLHVQTAGYSAGPHRGGGFRSEGRLPGLSPQRAEQLREELVQKAKGAKHGI